MRYHLNLHLQAALQEFTHAGGDAWELPQHWQRRRLYILAWVGQSICLLESGLGRCRAPNSWKFGWQEHNLIPFTVAHGMRTVDKPCHTLHRQTVWPSGLRRWLQAPVRKGVGSNHHSRHFVILCYSQKSISFYN